MAYVYLGLILAVIGFQIALIFGAPWGRVTQGGQVDGPLPWRGRLIAGVSILLLIGMGLAVLSADGRWPGWPSWTGWVALVVQGVSMVLNWITPSAPERRLWGPITTGMFVLALVVVAF